MKTDAIERALKIMEATTSLESDYALVIEAMAELAAIREAMRWRDLDEPPSNTLRHIELLFSDGCRIILMAKTFDRMKYVKAKACKWRPAVP